MKETFSKLMNLTLTLTMLFASFTLSVSANSPPEPPPPVPEDLTASVLPAWAQPPASSDNQDGPSAEIEQELLNTLAAEHSTDFVIVMEEKADLSAAFEIGDWSERGWYTYNVLREVANRTQAPVIKYAKKQCLTYQAFFSNNSVYIQGGDLPAVQDLAALPGVALIRQPKVARVHPSREESPTTPDTYGWNLDTLDPGNNLYGMQAAQVWDQYGIKGEGAVVANIDTGAYYQHEALDRQYRGNLTGDIGGPYNHDYNWYMPTYGCGDGTEPCDNDGHGSGTIGIMVGETEDLSEQIGVAPAAQWIACKGCEGVNCSEAALTGCADWMVAPCAIGDDPGDPSCNPDMRPYIINNSWGGGGCDTWYQGYIQAWVAAGIFPAFSAGNTVGCGTLGSPGDNPEAFGTAAHDSSGTNLYAGGPSCFFPNPSCDPDAYEVDPHLNAPTFGRTAGNGMGQYYNLSGTSGASPHTAGAIALIWSANPGYVGQIDDTFTILEQSTNHDVPEGDCGKPACAGTDPYPNYEYGWGYLDALAAVEMAGVGDTGTLAGTVTDGVDPVPDATIKATLSPTLTWRTTSDALGDYSMVVFSGTYSVDAYKYGHIPARISGVSVVSGTTTTQDITLPTASYYAVSGAVTDSATGDPLWATIDVAGDPVSPPATTLQTDRTTGYYSITLAGGITYTLDVDALMHNSMTRTVGPLTGDATENFTLVPTTTNGLIAGWVLDADTGAPIENATVQVDGGPSATTDVDGYYQMALVSPGFYTATASACLYSSETITGIEVPQSNIGWADFYLPTPHIEVEPAALSYTLQLGDQVTQTPGLVISSTGEGKLDFDLWEKKGGFQTTSLATGPFADAEPLVPPESQEVSTTKGLDLPPPPTGAILAAGDVIQSWPSGREAAWGIAYDGANSTVWVGDGWGGEDALFEYTPDGTPTGRSWPYIWSPASGPADSAFNWNTGMVWTLDVGDDNCIHEMDPAGGYTGNTICGPWTTSQRGVAYDPDTDTWYVGGWNEYTVYHIDSSGTLLDSANVGLAISGLAYNPETKHLFAIVNI